MTVMDPGDDLPSVSGGSPTTQPRQPPTTHQGPAPVPQLSAEQTVDYIAFYRGHIERLVAFLRWYGADLAEAADVAQETMIKAFHHWDTLTNPPAWVRTVASREFIRRRVRSVEDPTEEMLEEEPRSGLLRGDISVTMLEEQDEQLEVLRLLATLPYRQRQVMAWTYDGYAPSEIADQLTTEDRPLTAEAVRASLRLARRALVERLGPGKGQS